MSAGRAASTVDVMVNVASNPKATSTLGRPLWQLAALSLLAAPRVALHDLSLIPNSAVAAALVFAPAAIWIAATLRSPARSPLLTLLVIGMFYGVILALGHNLFWDKVFATGTPSLGGNLDGTLSPGTEEVVLRAAMSVSSLFTGAGTGLVCGLVAVLIQFLRGRAARR